jgi:eukaryotic-like serine/threonine-protein kinase
MYVRRSQQRPWRLEFPVCASAAIIRELDASDPSTQTLGCHPRERLSRNLVGQVISHYRILGRLGTGGMGVIYRAQDVRLGRHVALKFAAAEFQANPAVSEWIRREAFAGSALNHPNVCAVYDVGEHEGRPFIVMELLQGKTLRQQIHEWFELEPFLDLAIQIASGVDAVHSVGIVHRDIKPSNIFVTSSGRAKVFDFGLAVMPSERVLVQAANGGHAIPYYGELQGTPGYMSPEQLRCERVDARSDLFSLGAVYYEMLTARRAFRTATASAIRETIVHRPWAPIRKRRPELPGALERLVEKLLENDCSLRYQRAAEVVAELKRLRRHLGLIETCR